MFQFATKKLSMLKKKAVCVFELITLKRIFESKESIKQPGKVCVGNFFFFRSMLSLVQQISLQSRASFSWLWFSTVWKVFCCVFYWSVTLSNSRPKASEKSQWLKMEDTVEAASLIGSHKITPVPAASAATAPLSRCILLWGSCKSVDCRPS